jgi:hypothetical protein
MTFIVERVDIPTPTARFEIHFSLHESTSLGRGPGGEQNRSHRSPFVVPGFQWSGFKYCPKSNLSFVTIRASQGFPKIVLHLWWPGKLPPPPQNTSVWWEIYLKFCFGWFCLSFRKTSVRSILSGFWVSFRGCRLGQVRSFSTGAIESVVFRTLPGTSY